MENATHPPRLGFRDPSDRKLRFDNVLQHHQDMKPRKAILRKLQKEYPNGDRRLVLTKGGEVQYGQGRYRRKQTSAYRDPDGGTSDS